MGLAAPAFADIPQVVVAGKGHRYIVWLDPKAKDGVTVLPLTQQDMTRYCGAAQGFAQRMWKLTNGRHRIFQVEFNYGAAPARYDVLWSRYQGVAHALGLGSGRFYMFDAMTEARHTWSEGPSGIPGVKESCTGNICIQAACPAGLTIQDVAGETNRELCVDGNGTSPLEPATDAAYTLSHELSHSHYNLPDEYYNNELDATLYGFRVCANPVDWQTSVMATQTDFWCDANTHLFERFVASPFSGQQLVTDAGVKSHGDVWSIAKKFWADLNSYNPGSPVAHQAGSVPTNEYFTNPVGAWQPLAGEEFCKFTGSDFPNAVVNDVVMVVDKSGSMNYRFTEDDVTAYEAAFSAGLGQFNRTPPQRKAGLSVFDSTVTRSIPYSQFTGARSISEFNLTASGSTNLCEAINNTAAAVRAGGTNDAVGHMVLLTDGRPTVAGCNTAEAVRQAAYAACQPTDGSKAVVISALAFGDADYALIQQISDICGGTARTTDGNGGSSPVPPAGGSIPPGSPAPINIKVAAARLAYQTRGYAEAMFVQEPKPQTFERSFDVAPGTSEVEAVWMAEKVFLPRDPDAHQDFCRFEDYGFQVIDPNGNEVGTDIVPSSVELGYLTRSKRITAPMAGRWTMRTTGGAPCVVGGTQPAPQTAMLALYRNNVVRGDVSLAKTSIASNEALRVTATLQVGTSTAATNISVAAKIVNGATQLSLPMFDDGVTGGDEQAGDGRYTATLNPTCSSTNLTPGGYRVVVEFQSSAGTARSVLLPDLDVREAHGAGATNVEPPITVSHVEEKLLTVRACGSSAPGCAGAPAPANLCPVEQATVNGQVGVAPGTTRNDISVTIKNCPIAGKGVTVGMGAGVVTSNVRSTYNDATGTGTVTFNATAAANAPVGAQPLSIFWGPHKCDTSGASIPVCAPLPPTLSPASYTSCGGAAAQTVRLNAPSVAQSCLPNPTVVGVVLSRNGVAYNPPRSIAANGDISLDPGVYVVRWTVSGSAGTPVQATQTVNVLPAFAASGAFSVRDRAKIMRSTSQYAAIANAGSGATQVGVSAHAGDILSVGGVLLQDKSTVHGSIRTGGVVTRQNVTTVTGSVTEHVAIPLGGVVNPAVTFPNPPGADVTLELNQVDSRAPGSYGVVTLRKDSRLTLQAGDYLLTSLTIEPGARLIVAPGTRLFIKSSLIYRGLFSNAAGQLAPTFVAYYGTSDVFLESNFSGTMLAQFAGVILGDADSLAYSGSVLAKNVEVRPDVTLSCVAGTSTQVVKSLRAPGEVVEESQGIEAGSVGEAELPANEASLEAKAAPTGTEADGHGDESLPAATCTLSTVPSRQPGKAWWGALAGVVALTLARRRRASRRA